MKFTSVQIEIETVLRALGGNGTRRGFAGIIWGVTLALEDPNVLYAVTKTLYPAIGEAMDMNAQAILRDMRGEVAWCWETGDRNKLNEVAGRRLLDKPSVGEFIDMLAGYMRRRGF